MMIDHEKIEQAGRLMLEGIGEDPEREGVIDTAARSARKWGGLYGGTEGGAETDV